MDLQTPEQWLSVLAARLDYRQPYIALLRSYADGNAPLPEGGANSAATWMAFQRKARTNFGGIACQSHANRIRVQGVRVGSDDKSPASVTARRIARDNRFPMVIADAVWDMVCARTGYLVAGADEDGRALLTSEKPEMFYAEPDPTKPWRSRAALKVWRDTVAEMDYGYVWVPGVRQKFSRKSFTSVSANAADKTIRHVAAGGWEPSGDPEAYEGNPPVWILDRRDGMGLIEPHLDVIDRINLGKLQRLSVSAIQAFRQRALKKQPGVTLPETDEKGNVIDYSKVFEAAPGTLWDLPAGVEIWESAITDYRPSLDAEKADARDFSAATGTPVSMLQPDSANQSAGGAAATTAQQVDACNSDIDRIKLAAAAAIVTSLRIEGVDLGEDTVEVDFENPAWVTMAEKMDAYSKATAAGMSIKMAQKTYLGWTPDQIEEDDRNRARESARASLASLGGAPNVQPAQPAPQPMMAAASGNAG